VIRVGAPSDAELKSRKEALEDAISATKAAIAEGIVPGGGLTLLRAIDAVQREESNCDGDEQTGLRILKRALEVPTRQIAENSAVDGGVVVGKMREGTGNFGFDAARGVYGDLVEAGIIDPTKVIRLALENAVSVAGVGSGRKWKRCRPSRGRLPQGGCTRSRWGRWWRLIFTRSIHIDVSSDDRGGHGTAFARPENRTCGMASAVAPVFAC
jgi:hypothetical protein